MFRTKFDEFFSGHIMPIIGIDYSNENAYDERDNIHYYSLFHQEVIKQPLSELGCDPGALNFCCYCGCIPLDVSIRFAFSMWRFPLGVLVLIVQPRITIVSISSFHKSMVKPSYSAYFCVGLKAWDQEL